MAKQPKRPTSARRSTSPGDAADRDRTQREAGTSGMERVDPSTLSPAEQRRLRELLGQTAPANEPQTMLGNYQPARPKVKRRPT